MRVGELDVADGAGSLLHLPGHAVVALAAESDGPLHILPLARTRSPVLADRRQIVGPDVRRAAAVRAVHHEDVLARKLRAFVQRYDARVIPLGDLAEEHVGENFARA